MPAIDTWLEWKTTCALALCSPTTQTKLQAFVHYHYRRYVAGYRKETRSASAGMSASEAREAWHWFETYFQLHRNRQGKAYKDWLFARGAGPAAPAEASAWAIEHGVTLLLRDVVRECLRREGSPARTFSLDAPLTAAAGGEPVTLADLLPAAINTARDVERRELEDVSTSLVDTVIGAMPSRERIALLARERGLSCAHPAVLRAAGCGKSVLAKAYQAALRSVARGVRTAHPGESGDVLAALTVAVFAAVRRGILAWAAAEDRLADIRSI